MIYGIGVDILSVAQLNDLRGKYDDPFFSKTYSEKEYEAGLGRSDPIMYFAGRFAAKEAVLKALKINSGAFRFSDIETMNDDSGRPYVNLYGHTKELFDSLGSGRLHISLSRDVDYVIAYAVCEI